VKKRPLPPSPIRGRWNLPVKAIRKKINNNSGLPTASFESDEKQFDIPGIWIPAIGLLFAPARLSNAIIGMKPGFSRAWLIARGACPECLPREERGGARDQPQGKRMDPFNE
jgi:hypothetical protein